MRPLKKLSPGFYTFIVHPHYSNALLYIIKLFLAIYNSTRSCIVKVSTLFVIRLIDMYNVHKVYTYKNALIKIPFLSEQCCFGCHWLNSFWSFILSLVVVYLTHNLKLQNLRPLQTKALLLRQFYHYSWPFDIAALQIKMVYSFLSS